MKIFGRRRKVSQTLRHPSRTDITAEPTIKEMSSIATTMCEALEDLYDALKDVQSLGETDHRERRPG